jgi:CheY-like chemotaxis protein
VRWELIEAEDGEQAIQILRAEEQQHQTLPEIILLDWHLPRVTGGEVLRFAKEHEALRRIPVLIFSRSKADDDIRDAYSAHANAYLIKPDDADLLAEIVKLIEDFWTTHVRISKVARTELFPVE